MKRGADSSTQPQRGLTLAAVAVLCVAYFGAVLAATRGRPAQALFATVQAVVPALLLGAAVVRIGRRVRWFDGGRPRLALIHALLATGFSVPWNASVIAGFAVEHQLSGRPGHYQLRFENLGFGLFTGLLLYAGLAGAAFGVETSGRLRVERERAARAETLRVRAELAALRAQLNPHFLFNTLHTVLGLVRRDPALAEEALEDLGDVLRYALNVQRDHEPVALREELEMVSRYLAIERVRLGQRLRVEEEVSAAAAACLVPAFTLQPVVENAVRYAVAPRAAGGRVRIEARVESEVLLLRVSDDGTAPPPAGGEGMGLTLVRQRLETAFGATAELRAEQTEAGFVVTMRVPQRGPA